MTMSTPRLATFASVAAVLVLAGCEDPPQQTEQSGYRGIGMEQVQSPEREARLRAANQVPEPLPAADPGGPKAGEVYQNVQVLTDLSVGEFARLMNGITEWVAPEAGCTYCHEGGNFASDAVYTKVVARHMLEMTQAINADWGSHVKQTGVTCFTCHRGQPVPREVWFKDTPPTRFEGMAGNRAGQNRPAEEVAYASLPEDPFSAFLDRANDIRVASTQALPGANRTGIMRTEWTYGLMMHMSDSLGVNCTYCHNSRVFWDWTQSSPQRVNAWHGIRMVRELNNQHLTPITEFFPRARLGPTGDVAKVACSTCHQGVSKPLYGAEMLADYPSLAAPAAAATDAAPAQDTSDDMGDAPADDTSE